MSVIIFFPCLLLKIWGMHRVEMSCKKLLDCMFHWRQRTRAWSERTCHIDPAAKVTWEDKRQWRTMIIQQVLLLVLLWVCLLHPSLTAMVFTRTSDYQPKDFVERGVGNDGKVLHRQKRGWMWNQFFLLEEYTGSDYQYVGKVSLLCSFSC